MSSRRPMTAPPASSRGRRITRNAQISSLPAMKRTLSPVAATAGDGRGGAPGDEAGGEGPTHVTGEPYGRLDVARLRPSSCPDDRSVLDAIAVPVGAAESQSEGSGERSLGDARIGRR